jgi:hypothetical protein
MFGYPQQMFIRYQYGYMIEKRQMLSPNYVASTIFFIGFDGG